MALLRTMRCSWPGPCRDFVPAADPLSVPPESGQRAAPRSAAPRCARGSLRDARWHARVLRQASRSAQVLRSVPPQSRSPRSRPTRCVHYAQTGAASQFLKRAAHVPRRPVMLGGSKGEAQNSQQPKCPPLPRRANLDGQLGAASRTLHRTPLVKTRRFCQKFNGRLVRQRQK